MLVKALGIIDIISALILLVGSKELIGPQILFLFGVILILKSSLGMWKDFFSWVDLLAGVVLLLEILTPVTPIVKIIFALILLYKGAVSFL